MFESGRIMSYVFELWWLRMGDHLSGSASSGWNSQETQMAPALVACAPRRRSTHLMQSTSRADRAGPFGEPVGGGKEGRGLHRPGQEGQVEAVC